MQSYSEYYSRSCDKEARHIRRFGCIGLRLFSLIYIHFKKRELETGFYRFRVNSSTSSTHLHFRQMGAAICWDKAVDCGKNAYSMSFVEILYLRYYSNHWRCLRLYIMWSEEGAKPESDHGIRARDCVAISAIYYCISPSLIRHPPRPPAKKSLQ